MKDKIIKDLQDGIAVMQNAIKQLEAMSEQPSQDGLTDLIPYKEVLTRVGISRNTLLKLEKEGAITIHRMSPRKLYVSISELVQAIKNH